MQKFEDIIQQAFAKIDAANPKLRQKVYENIWLIQERALAQQNIDEAQKQRWRNNLTALLKDTENQYRRAATPQPAPEAAPPPRPNSGNFSAADNLPRQRAAAPARPQAAAQRPDFALPQFGEPAVPAGGPGRRPAEPNFFADDENRPPRRNAAAGAPPLSAPAEFAAEFAPETAGRRAAGRSKSAPLATETRLEALEDEVNREVKQDFAEMRSFWRRIKISHYIIGVSSVFVALFVAWSFYNSFGGAAPDKPARFSGPVHQNNYGMNGWTQVFSPDNADSLAKTGAAAVDLHNDPDAQFIRITGLTPDKDAAILNIGQGALQNLRGKTATFKLVARSAEDQRGQLNLAADFGDNTPPRRYNFELSPAAESLLFRLDIPQNLKNGARFYLSNGKTDGKPHQIDVFALLLRESDNKGR